MLNLFYQILRIVLYFLITIEFSVSAYQYLKWDSKYLYAQEYYQNRHLGGDGELHILVFSWIPKLVDDFPVSGDDDDNDNDDDDDDDVDVNDVHDYDDDDIFGEIRCWLIAFLCQLHKE